MTSGPTTQQKVAACVQSYCLGVSGSPQNVSTAQQPQDIDREQEFDDISARIAGMAKDFLNGLLVDIIPLPKRMGSGSLLFDGTDDYLNCGNHSDLWSQSLSKFSFSFWWYQDTLASTNDRWLVDHGGANNHAFRCLNRASDQAITFALKSSGGVVNLASHTTYDSIGATGSWRHIVCTYDNSLGSANVKVFVNKSQGGGTANFTEAINFSAILSLATTNSPTNSPNMHVKDFRFWFNRALTQTEINDVCSNVDTAPTPDYWLPMFEGSGNPVDYIKGKTTTLTNGATWSTLFPSIWEGKFGFFKYDIAERIAKELTAKYDIFQRIVKELTTIYDDLQRISKEGTFLYDIYQRISKELTSLYDIIGRITKEGIFKYDIFQRITKELTSLYDIFQRISKEGTFLYDIYQRVSKELTSLYDILGRIAKEYILKYDISERVAKELTALYDIFQRVAKEGIFKYDILERISKELTAIYDIFEQGLDRITKEMIFLYDITGRISKEGTFIYDDFQRITKEITALYDIYHKVTKEVTLLYDILQRISNEGTFLYDVFQRITKEGTFLYDALARIFKENTFKYDISGRITKELTAIYDIASDAIFRIEREITLLYKKEKSIMVGFRPAVNNRYVKAFNKHAKKWKPDFRLMLQKRIKSIKKRQTFKY